MSSEGMNLVKRYEDQQLQVECSDVRFVGGEIYVTRHTFITLFNIDVTIKLFLLPALKTFQAIVGHSTLKELSAVIYGAEVCMIAQNRLKTHLKQLR